MVLDQIIYFESLANTMNTKTNTNKLSSSKKNSKNNPNDLSNKKLKKIFNDFIEIKRPHNKQKPENGVHCYNKPAGNSNTIPRTQKNNESSPFERTASTKMIRRSLTRDRCGKNKDSLVRQSGKEATLSSETNCDLNSTINEIIIGNDNVGDLTEDSEDTEFSEFVERLRNKRKSRSCVSEDMASTEEQDDNIDEDKLMVEGINHDIDEGAISEQQDSSEEEYFHNVSTFLQNQEDNDTDIFGLNDFDENGDDNYIIEAYNDDERELVFTFLEIKRKSIKPYDAISELINNSDMVLRENEDNFELIKNMIDQTEALQLHDSDMKSEDEYNNLNLPQREADGGSSSSSSVKTKDSFNDHYDYAYGSGNVYYHKKSYSDDLPLYDSLYDDGYYENSYHQKHLSDEHFNVPQYENICDKHGNIRIQRVAENVAVSSTEVGKKKNKINYIIEELIKTEEQYIAGLRKVVLDYMPYVEKNSPSNLLGKSTYIFGNIKDIYENAQQFLVLLKQVGEDVEEVAQAFIQSESIFYVYPQYSKNKPNADIHLKEFDKVIKARQKELGDKLDLTSYLLTPIQRLGKYTLMLQNIQKELKKKGETSQNIDFAINIVKKVMKKGNDGIAIDSIKNCSIDLSIQGSFIKREKFNVIKPKKFESMVFLFEKIIVFTQNVTKYSEEFTYVDSIYLSDLSIAAFEEEPLIFHLTDYPKAKRLGADRSTYVLEAKNSKIKHIWTTTIEARLWDQLTQAKEQQKQMHSDEGKRFSKIDLPVKRAKGDSKRNRSLSHSKSIFYFDHH